jgi:aminocarboxymuconate-semialdehyde decarboxylase
MIGRSVNKPRAPMKIDMHTHILPRTWPDLRERFGYGGFISLEPGEAGRVNMMLDGSFFRAVDPNCFDLSARLDDCDRTGVTMQGMCTVPVMFGYHAEPAHGLELARMLNDHLAEFVAQRPDRFFGLGTLPMQAPDKAATELARVVGELGMPGVQIGSSVEGRNLDEPAFDPLWEAAQDLDAAILVHPWDMLGADRTQKYWMRWLVGMPAETTLAACSLLFGGVFDRFPKLRVCLSHAGGSLLFTIGRIEHGFNVRPDLCQLHTDTPPSAHIDKLYFDTITHDPGALRFIMSCVKPEKLMLGSDYPFPLGEHHPGKMIETEMPELSEATRTQLLSGTALDFFKLRDRVGATG